MSDLSRTDFLAASAAATAVKGGHVTAAAGDQTLPLQLRWYGGGVYELATPDDKHVVLVDAWIWNNTGWAAFNLTRPPELASAVAYAAHLKGRGPDAVIVALTHDHGDHIGDYFELLRALVDAGIDVKTVGQSDLMRVGLVPRFKQANLDNTTIVLNNGNGINVGGTAAYKGIRLELVPAVHSTLLGFPSAGFIIDVGGVRVWASGDTDLYGDITLIATRYRPDIAFVCVGNGAYTMGPPDAARAVKMAGVGHAVPVHYAHNPLVLGPAAADMFRDAVAREAPGVTVSAPRPGERTTLHVRTFARA
ncbi:MAG: MBL fold metallo-hydrolase [Candidatus Eremiobacteraeota bacterium]|nr:MBL fold metallo-hydrolase [Candidatus Eremiobacteraeota bacterium]